MAAVPLRYLRLKRQARQMLHAGAVRTETGAIQAHYHGGCEAPVLLKLTHRSIGKMPSLEIQITGRCRRCNVCKRYRASHWAERAMRELMVAERTWFATLTFRPEIQVQVEARCRSAVGLACGWDDLTLAERMRDQCRILSPSVTRWMKRLRKAGLRFRYLLVAEPHKSELVHYHVFLHENDPNRPIRKNADLDGTWLQGFSSFELVKTLTDHDRRKAAWYACKYITKNSETRIRASLRYGDEIYARAAYLRNLFPEVDLIDMERSRSIGSAVSSETTIDPQTTKPHDMCCLREREPYIEALLRHTSDCD